jgi:hypothetical protein
MRELSLGQTNINVARSQFGVGSDRETRLRLSLTIKYEKFNLLTYHSKCEKLLAEHKKANLMDFRPCIMV